MRKNLDWIEFIEFGSVCVIFENWGFGVVRWRAQGVAAYEDEVV